MGLGGMDLGSAMAIAAGLDPATGKKVPTLFVLRRKSDKVMMPDFKGRAGGTYVNPDRRDTHTGTPRLFTTRKAAGEALRWWAKGMVRVTYTGGFSADSLDPPEPDPDFKSVPVAGRNAEDWEIVPVEITAVVETIA